jgi:hypothetical protein
MEVTRDIGNDISIRQESAAIVESLGKIQETEIDNGFTTE